MAQAFMRTALLLLLVMTIDAQAASPRWQVVLREATERGERTGTLTFERGPARTRWDLVCTHVSDGAELKTTRLRGTAPSRAEWVVAKDDGPKPSRLFSLALERSAPLWLSTIEGCPTAAVPSVRRISRGSDRP